MLKADIAELLTNEHPNTLTNRQIANRLSAPEPSVRRATASLESTGRVRASWADDAPMAPIPWQANVNA